MVTALFRISTREARKKLRSRDEPYWQELCRGRHLGYRRGTTGGSWYLREHKAEAGTDGRGGYVKRRLGIADDDVPADGLAILSFEDAQRLALGDDRPTVTVPGKHTVAEAWKQYSETRAKPIDERERAIWAAFIAPEFGTRDISEISTGDLERWLAEQVAKHGAKRKRDKDLDPKELLRLKQNTAKRRWHLFVAILNSAYRKHPESVPSADAWRRVQAFQRVDQPRLRVITAVEARRLLNAAPPWLRKLARAALYTGCRLGELQALRAAHVDVDSKQLHIQHSKSGRPRTVPLTADGAEFFEQMIAGKTGEALVFEPVGRMAVSRGMRQACAAAKITPAATYHDLRRSFGSLLLNSGAPIEVIQEVLGHADARMTRRVYAHLLQKTVRKAVDKHLPSFGLERTNVRTLTPRPKHKRATSP